MIEKDKLKQMALALGADDVGIGSLDRFDGAPPEMDPRHIAPNAKSIIGLLFRIPRGYIRGIEEGTHFMQYPSMGYGGINENYAPQVLYELGKYIEDQKYEAIVYRNTGGRSTLSDMTGKSYKDFEQSPEMHQKEKTPGNRRGVVARNTKGLAAPDVQFHFRIAGFICGLGEIGYSKMLLNDKFGPLNRQAFILTDAEIEPDPMYERHLCNDCKACVRHCPGNCISGHEQVKINVAGNDIHWGELAEWSCFAYYVGANRSSNPFLEKDAFKHLPDGDKIIRGEFTVSSKTQPEIAKVLDAAHMQEIGGYGTPKCGGCLRACYDTLEKRGVLKNKFKNKFRTKKPWKLEI